MHKIDKTQKQKRQLAMKEKPKPPVFISNAFGDMQI